MGQAQSLLDNTEFIVDLARYAEKLISEDAVRKKYKLPEDVWAGLGNDEELVSAIEAEKVRRIRNGASARERAQQLFATAPDVLGEILNDETASARHRIESAKELRAVAANTGPEAAPTTDEKFHITIVLNADNKIRVSKATGLVPNDDVEAIEHDADTAPQLLTAIAAKKDDDDDSRGGAW